MREQGWCSKCKYPVERERIIRPVRTEIPFSFYETPDVFIPSTSTYDRTETIHYYADGREVITCPGCESVLLTGDKATDTVNMEVVRFKRQLK